MVNSKLSFITLNNRFYYRKTGFKFLDTQIQIKIRFSMANSLNIYFSKILPQSTPPKFKNTNLILKC